MERNYANVTLCILVRSSMADLGWNEVWRQEVTDNVNQVVIDNSQPMNGTRSPPVAPSVDQPTNPRSTLQAQIHTAGVNNLPMVVM